MKKQESTARLSIAEENYLKAIYKLTENTDRPAATTAIAEQMQTAAASVTDMLKRLADKGLIHYERYKGVSLTDEGMRLATHLVRKHRLWEVFLVDKLGFGWDKVHDIAEQLEHIRSPELVERLDEFLGRPRFDPHGDPIPDAEGQFAERQQTLLCKLAEGQQGVIVGVAAHAPSFLQFLDKLALVLGTRLQVVERFDFDDSMKVRLPDEREVLLSSKVTHNLFVQKLPA